MFHMESTSAGQPKPGEFFILEAGKINGPTNGVVFENLDQLLSPPRLILLPEGGGFPPLRETPRLVYNPSEGPPLFQDHHAIEQQTLDRSPLLKALSKAGHFDIHAPENRLFLPSDPALRRPWASLRIAGGPSLTTKSGYGRVCGAWSRPQTEWKRRRAMRMLWSASPGGWKRCAIQSAWASFEKAKYLTALGISTVSYLSSVAGR